MGQSTNGILAYGYDLGGGDDDFKVREAGEYGELQVDWYGPGAEDEDAEDDFESAAMRRLLEAAGFTETDWSAEGYFARERAAKEALGVELESYCSGDYPMYVLAAKVITAHRGDCDALDIAAMTDPATLAAYDEKLSAALAALGITPTQEKPAWLLCSYKG